VTAAPAEASRDATAAEVGEVAGLCRRAVSELAAERGGALASSAGDLAEPYEDAVLDRLLAPDGLVAVGTLDGAVVGAAVARCADLRDGRRLAVVDLIYVVPAAREVGVGESLLERVMAWAVERGCAGVDAPALPGMRESKNFFERAGFVARLLVMHRPTGP
jgi:GNAT superfamily N-acetyltransferase